MQRRSSRAEHACKPAAERGVPTDWLQADRQLLAELKQYQESVRLGDDVAADMVKEAARANIEADLDAAVECIKARTRERDVSDALNAVRDIAAPQPRPSRRQVVGLCTGGVFQLRPPSVLRWI